MTCAKGCAKCARDGTAGSTLSSKNTFLAIALLFAAPFSAFCLGCFIGLKYFSIEGYAELIAVVTGFILMAGCYFIIGFIKKER